MTNVNLNANLPQKPIPKVEAADKDGRNKRVTTVEKTEDAPTTKANISISSDLNKPINPQKETAKEQLLSTILLKDTKHSPAASLNPTQSALAHFLQLKQSPLLSDKLAAANLSPQDVGLKEWVIGMVGLLYDPTVNNPGELQTLIARLLSFVTKDSELFLLGHSLNAVSTRLAALPPEGLTQITQILKNSGLLQSKDPVVKQQAQSFLDTLSLRGATNETTVLPQAGPAISTLSESARSKLLALLIQINIFSKIAQTPEKNAWALLYAALMGIETSITALDGESNPYIPDSIGLIIPENSYLAPEWLGIKAIKSTSQYEEAIKKLYSMHMKRVFALVPHQRFDTAHEEIYQVLEEIPQRVKAFETQTFGPAFGELVAAIASGLYRSGVKLTSDMLIRQTIDRFRYWVIPQYSTVGREDWFQLLPRRSSMRPNLYPILNFHHGPACLQALSSHSESINYIEQMIQEEISGYDYKNIKISYNGHYKMGVELFAKLQSLHPTITIEITESNENVTHFFGQHLSVSLV